MVSRRTLRSRGTCAGRPGRRPGCSTRPERHGHVRPQQWRSTSPSAVGPGRRRPRPAPTRPRGCPRSTSRPPSSSPQATASSRPTPAPPRRHDPAPRARGACGHAGRVIQADSSSRPSSRPSRHRARCATRSASTPGPCSILFRGRFRLAGSSSPVLFADLFGSPFAAFLRRSSCAGLLRGLLRARSSWARGLLGVAFFGRVSTRLGCTAACSASSSSGTSRSAPGLRDQLAAADDADVHLALARHHGDVQPRRGRSGRAVQPLDLGAHEEQRDRRTRTLEITRLWITGPESASFSGRPSAPRARRCAARRTRPSPAACPPGWPCGGPWRWCCPRRPGPAAPAGPRCRCRAGRRSWRPCCSRLFLDSPRTETGTEATSELRQLAALVEVARSAPPRTVSTTSLTVAPSTAFFISLSSPTRCPRSRSCGGR